MCIEYITETWMLFLYEKIVDVNSNLYIFFRVHQNRTKTNKTNEKNYKESNLSLAHGKTPLL